MSNEAVVTRRYGEPKMCEGWLEHKTSSQNWQKVWFLLRGRTIYVFKSDDTTPENQLGNLTIDDHTMFEIRERGDPRRGFKFDLKTGQRLNRFRTTKSAEREEWRAYIMGLATGRVPNNLDLLQKDINRIQDDIDAQRMGRSNRESNYSGPESGIFVDPGSMRSFSLTNACGSSGSTDSDSRGSRLDPGGPVMTHRFYPDRSDDRVPSWFFSKCSRHTAETILRNIHDYGNTLLRESSTHKDNGSYVISKSFLNKTSGQYEVEHYEVMRVAKGYRINVENEQPQMTCLLEVMDYFVSTTGGSAKPMTTNDMRRLGMAEPDYETGRIRGPPEPASQPWVWPPPDYDDVTFPPNHRHSDARTVTPGILKKSQSNPENERRWSEQPATVAYYPRREMHRTSTNIDDIQQRVHQTATLQDLDNAISSGFQHDQIYVNMPDEPPPPPLPHKPSPNSYINNPVGDDPALRELPEAPPPPTYRNRTSGPPSQTTPSSSNFQSRQRPQEPKSNSPAVPDVKAGAFVPPVLKKISNDGPGKDLPKSPGSPASFPTWTEPKQVLKSPQNVNSQEFKAKDTVNGANDSADTASSSGVDETTPGGVSDLKSKFEKSTSLQSPTSPQAKTSPGAGKGLSEEFKRKLENTIGNSSTMPVRQINRQSSANNEERVYEELPDIVPDAVTYVNEKYNK